MRVVVDFDLCASTGSCTQICPEVFEIRSDGYLYVLQENPDSILREKLLEAEDLCPTGAITIEEWRCKDPSLVGHQLHWDRTKENTVTFFDMLSERWRSADSVLCVGLDPDISRLPDSFQSATGGIAKFCIDIIDATAEFACAFKPQIAYFSAVGAERQLELVCEHIRDAHPTIPIILDAKRGDIGDTAKLYAREAFERYGAHAVTVNPYLGTDSLEPFFAHRDKGVFVLCRTSNEGSNEFQSLNTNGSALYEHIAHTAATKWAQQGQIGLVVGATQPQELASVREIVGNMPLLVPGVGAQGGDPALVMKNASTADGYGVVVNSSRAILFADDKDHVTGARQVAKRTRDQLRS